MGMTVECDADGDSKEHPVIGLLNRVDYYPQPPPGFDPLKASEFELEEFGLPPRPLDNQPELFANWHALLSSPLEFVDPALELLRVGYRLDTRESPILSSLSGTTRYETSSTWSGAYVTPHHGNMLVEIWARWVIPTPTLPLPPEQVPPQPGNVQYVCTAFIGFDGQRRYLNSSLPQIGTKQVLTVQANGQMTASATTWWQWWSRDQPGQPCDIGGVPAVPGDLVLAHLRVQDREHVQFYIKNHRTGAFARFRARTPTSNQGVRLQISGATAEWILERPTIVGDDKLYPFPNYGIADFHHCVTAMAHDPGGPTSVRRLGGARLIRMFDILHDPERTAFISIGEKRNDNTIRTSYRQP
jgi:hypothetical protein